MPMQELTIQRREGTGKQIAKRLRLIEQVGRIALDQRFLVVGHSA